MRFCRRLRRDLTFLQLTARYSIQSRGSNKMHTYLIDADVDKQPQGPTKTIRPAQASLSELRMSSHWLGLFNGKDF